MRHSVNGRGEVHVRELMYRFARVASSRTSVTMRIWRAVWRRGLNPSCPAQSIPLSSMKSERMVWTTMV